MREYLVCCPTVEVDYDYNWEGRVVLVGDQVRCQCDIECGKVFHQRHNAHSDVLEACCERMSPGECIHDLAEPYLV